MNECVRECVLMPITIAIDNDLNTPSQALVSKPLSLAQGFCLDTLTHSHWALYKVLICTEGWKWSKIWTLTRKINMNFMKLINDIIYYITHNLAPKYLQDLVFLRSSSSARSLRSSHSMQLTHGPRTKTRYGDRAFSSIAPSLWNKLPPHIQNAPSTDSFKALLKTYLFNQT